MNKLRKQAKELLQAASKVYHYRRDVISEGRLEELDQAVGEVDAMLKDKTTEAAPFQAAQNRLDALLRKIGGKIHPKTFFSDNLEVVLVAAILVIGVRTFFFQPFIIPTNSMYPTYSGMNSVVYSAEDASPNVARKIFNKLTLGSNHKSVFARNSGEILIPMSQTATGPQIDKEQVQGRKWFVLPTVLAEYTFYVGGVAHTLQVPAEFDMNQLLTQAFASSQSKIVQTAKSRTGVAWSTGVSVEAGEPIIQFDITLGDALFVDRLSYHFIRPQAGDPFVFRTNDISEELGRLTGDYTDKYYIKRIGGIGGETLEIKDGALYVDGQQRDEVEVFGRNAIREGEYGGYLNRNLLGEGRELKIPDDKFVALGDNSANSLDSRYWGFVPERSVIGRAIFIYYPFTKRWGPAE
jgi:signal peptidase I